MESKKIGLALSGGGYRATLFGLGTLIRLNEMGLLKKISRITSVSGGSILNATLAANWNSLTFDEDGVATNFKDVIGKDILDFCAQTTLGKVRMVVGAFIPLIHPVKAVREKYDELLFKGKPFSSLTNIAGAPQFLFYATNLQTGSSLRMTDSLLYDYKIGAASIADWSISQVVAISGAFPPVLSPVTIKMKGAAWARSSMQVLYDDKKFEEVLELCDGGLYDNLGIECLWKKTEILLDDQNHAWNAVLKDDIDICLVSDAGAPFQYSNDPGSAMVRQVPRIIDILTEQTRALRKRGLVAKYMSREDQLDGTYWGITTKISDYQLSDPFTVDTETSKAMGNIPTTLSAMSDDIEGRLVNWGYALADTAMRKHLPELAEGCRQLEWPYPEFALS